MSNAPFRPVRLTCALALALSAAGVLLPEQVRRLRAASPVAVTIIEQGSFAVGGSVTKVPNGDTSRGDHAYVQYQIPANAKRYPIVMWHGAGQFSKTWETTPDGRDGYQNIFLRKGYAVYILDQPRRGRGGRGGGAMKIPAAGGDADLLFNTFRLGRWTGQGPPEFFPNVQVSRTAAAIDQYARQGVPNSGPEDRDANVAAVSALFDKIGPAILLTHSNSGQYGWLTRVKSPNVKAIISYEPATFTFPDDGLPAALTTKDARVNGINEPIVVTPAEFAELTRVPIQIVYGDNIERTMPSPVFGVELWRVVTQRAQQFVNLINSRGGRVTVLNLPDVGLKGGTHFPFSDLNNVEVAELLSTYLHEERLDERGGSRAPRRFSPTSKSLVVVDQGSFAVGGVTKPMPNGDTARGDHAYVQYQLPPKARKYPIVMWHGGGQFSKTWETTPDGREGFQNIFLRQRFSVYTLDQPRRGRAAKSMAPAAFGGGMGGESNSWNTFRLGAWIPPARRTLFPGVSFPTDEASIDQYWRQTVANYGPEESPTVVSGVAALFDTLGQSILLTHSQSGRYGWLTRIKSSNVKAIVSYEPATFTFPSDALPRDITTTDNAQVKGLNEPIVVTPAEFAELTKVPIQIIYGDYIEHTTPSPLFGVELWRVVTKRAKQFVDEVNKRGGHATLVHLPEIGIKGNTHFPFSDLNNIEVAARLSKYLKDQKLD